MADLAPLPKRSLVTRVVLFIAKFLGAVVLLLVVGVVGFLAYVILTPEFHMTVPQARSLMAKYLPANLKITFDDMDLSLTVPEGHLFAKHLKLSLKNFCVDYEAKAVDACFSRIDLGASAGWGGPLPVGKSKWIPQLLSIDPVVMLKGNVAVDVPRLPKSDPNKPKSSFDVVKFLRTEILPKWNIEGSRIEMQKLALRLNADSSYRSSFDLTTAEDRRTIKAELHEFAQLNSALKAQALITVTRPEGWMEDAGPTGSVPRLWKVFANGLLNIDKTRSAKLKADADIESWQTLDFRISTVLRGIAALKEVRLSGALRQGKDLDGLLSLKVGATNAEVRALDFVNCKVDLELDKKVGGLSCGPQNVRLQLTERSFLRRPELFRLTPGFDLKITKLDFGDTKSASFDLDLRLDHYDILTLRSHITGDVVKAPDKDLRYEIKGGLQLAVAQFERVVKLLSETPYSVPAPMNVLAGTVGVTADVAWNQDGGRIGFQSATKLDSPNQAVYLRLEGATQLAKTGKKGALEPDTNASFFIDSLKISAPRFDLRVPPRFNPDPRFGPIVNDHDVAKAQVSAPMKFRLNIKTTQPGAIRITTNLTKAPIPIDVDLVYNDLNRSAKPKAAASTSVSGTTNGARPLQGAPQQGVPPDVQLEEQDDSIGQKSPITGSVIVGQVPVDLFRRNAQLQQFRVDFLENGDQRIDGRADVNYLDYKIFILVQGKTSDPQIRFVSEPPLDSDQILAVLIFGRELNQLQDDQKASVGSMNAAFADAALGVSSLYLLASTPIESVGYDAERGLVTAKVGLGGGTSLEVGGGSDTTALGLRKRLSRDFIFRSDVEQIGTTGKKTVSALIEWVKRF